jgi:hypothetical protein
MKFIVSTLVEKGGPDSVVNCFLLFAANVTAEAVLTTQQGTL